MYDSEDSALYYLSFWQPSDVVLSEAELEDLQPHQEAPPLALPDEDLPF